MKVKKLLKVASVAVLASTLAACGKEKVSEKEYKKWAEDNGYVLESAINHEGWAGENGYVLESEVDHEEWAEENGKVIVDKEIDYTVTPTLEIAFGKKYEVINGKTMNAKVTNQDNVAVVIGVSGCTGCSGLKESGELDKFVENYGYRLYYYEYNAADTIASWIQENVFAGDEVTGPTLVAFTYNNIDATHGKVAGVWKNISTNTAENIASKLQQVYTFEDFGDFTENAELAELYTVQEIVEEVLSGNTSIMFFSRYTCPACQAIKNTGGQYNFITRLAKDTDGEGLRMFYILSDIARSATVEGEGATAKNFDEKVQELIDEVVYTETGVEEALVTWLGASTAAKAVWNAEARDGAGQWEVNGAKAVTGKIASASELAIYAVALGHVVIDENSIDQNGNLTEAFWNAVRTWANSDTEALVTALGEDIVTEKMYLETRLTPAFIAVNYKEGSNKYINVNELASNEHNQPINTFHGLPRVYGVKPEAKLYAAVELDDYNEMLYLRFKLFVDTWAKEGVALNTPAA